MAEPPPKAASMATQRTTFRNDPDDATLGMTLPLAGRATARMKRAAREHTHSHSRPAPQKAPPLSTKRNYFHPHCDNLGRSTLKTAFGRLMAKLGGNDNAAV